MCGCSLLFSLFASSSLTLPLSSIFSVSVSLPYPSSSSHKLSPSLSLSLSYQYSHSLTHILSLSYKHIQLILFSTPQESTKSWRLRNGVSGSRTVRKENCPSQKIISFSSLSVGRGKTSLSRGSRIWQEINLSPRWQRGLIASYTTTNPRNSSQSSTCYNIVSSMQRCPLFRIIK